LIIEDNKDLRSFIRDCLQPQYDCAEAGDGQQGVAEAIELVPDIIISDIMMPKKDGNELSKSLITKPVLTEIQNDKSLGGSLVHLNNRRKIGWY